MITRVTNPMLTATASRGLRAGMSDLARLQDTASSGVRLTRPSDDPAATASALRVRSAQAAHGQYSRNIDDATGWLVTLDTSLGNATDTLRSARNLTVQGSNASTMSVQAREALAIEISSLRDALLAEANTEYLGRSVYAGNSIAGAAFDADYAFSGAPGSTVTRRIDDTTAVRVDADGARAFGEGDASAFALLDRIVADLRAGQPINSHLDAIDERMAAISTERSAVGARHAQVERGKELLMAADSELEAQRSSLEDADLATTLIELKMQEVAYQAALSVTARALQPSLLQFLS